MTKAFSGLAALVTLAIASPALASPITLDSGDVGTSFNIGFDGFVDDSSNTIDGLSGDISFTLQSVSANQYDFSYLVANTSSDGVSSRITSFAFDTDPQISGASATGAYSYVVLDGGYPNQIGSVDVCFKSGASNACQGNSGGVSEGSTGSGTLSLMFSDALDSLTLSDFFVRYQGISGAGNVTSASGQEVTSSTTTSSTSTSGGTSVPEPGMLGLFALALAAIGLGRRRLHRSKARRLQPAFA